MGVYKFFTLVAVVFFVSGGSKLFAGTADQILKESKKREKDYYKRLRRKRQDFRKKEMGASKHKAQRAKEIASYKKKQSAHKRPKASVNWKSYMAFSKEKSRMIKKRARRQRLHSKERKRLERLRRRYIRLKKKTEYGLENIP